MPPTDVNQVLKFRSGRGWGHAAYDQRIKVIAKMQKKKFGCWGRGGGQGGYEQRTEVIVKIAKKNEGVPSRGGVGVRVDANIELKLLWKCKKKKKRLGWGPLWG